MLKNYWKFLVTRFIGTLLPFIALIVSITILLYNIEASNEKKIIENKEEDVIGALSKIIISDFNFVAADLIVLVEGVAIQKMFDDSANAKLTVSNKFLLLATQRKIYDQIAFLNEKGMEVIRINFDNEIASIVPEKKLQNKLQSYYFKDIFKLKRGEIYISPFDLNVEHGKIVLPVKPIIRFGTPVFDINGNKRGVVMFHYLGKEILEDIEMATIQSPGRIMLLNSDGFWLKGINPEDEWGFMYKDRKYRTFKNLFPDEWKLLSSAESGSFYTPNGLFTFSNIYPFIDGINSNMNKTSSKSTKLQAKKYHWKIVSYVPNNILNSHSNTILDNLIKLNSWLLIFLGFIAWLVALISLKRKLAEKEINRLAAIVESSDDAIIGKTPEGIIFSWNKGAEILYGYSPEEVIGKPVSIIIPAELHENLENFYAKIKQGESIHHYETIRIKKDGKRIVVSLTLSPIKDEKGKIIGISAIARDITNRKIAEKKLKETMINLERSNKELEQFASIAAHDLQEPLRKIQMFGDRLKTKYTDILSEQGQDYLCRMQNAATRMEALITDLLTLSRLTTRAQPFIIVDINKTIKDVVSDLEAQIKETDGSIEIQELPVIEADPIQMHQLFQNLISNSLKFHQINDKPVVQIYSKISDEVQGNSDNSNCQIFVKDNGIGFDEKYGERIFVIFQRLHNRQEYKGTGIGLAICKKIVERHGGHITAKSIPGKGATFIITLPLKQNG